ncbi:MAG: hypothetical protein Kow00129_04320 [Thermoleophilia bacterium]
MQKVHGRQVVYRLCPGMVAQPDVVAAETQDVTDSKSVRRQQIPHKSEPVPVSACDLQNRLEARLEQPDGRAPRALRETSGRHIGHVYRVNNPSEHLSPIEQRADPGLSGRQKVGGHGETAGLESLLELGPSHGLRPKCT